jgi:predicted CXXCH cytochrome family protein
LYCVEILSTDPLPDKYVLVGWFSRSRITAMFDRSVLSRLGVTAAVIGALGLLSSCTSEKIVFRDREPFNPPPDAANGFLGYFTASTKQTTCGNCHVGHQAQWASSLHSGAFNTLANSGAAQSFCYTCHTVSDKGNAVVAPAGYDATPDAAYHDVQCENCHGPGINHVTAPDTPGNVPLAHVAVLGADSAASCAACHSGVHNPFVEEWSQSGHATSLQESPGVFVADNASCSGCHEGKAVLANWGSTSNYAEKSLTGNQNFLGITCAVCHDPHGSPNSHQLRFPINTPDMNQNLCMKCHSRRYEPVANSSRGPHAPQGAVLTGTAGWWPAGYDTTAIVATHGNVAVNTRLCAGCHVNRFQVTDAATGSLIFNSTGHLFRPVPCLDASGIPIADDSCAFTTAARSFQACTASGCHSSQAAAQSAFSANRSVLATLADQIWIDNPAGTASEIGVPDAGDQGFLSKIPSTEYNTTDNVITVAEGVLFNMRLVAEDRYANGDRSFGVHNPFLAQALLTASIQALNATYGPFPAPPAQVKAIMDDVNRRILLNRAAYNVSQR